MNAAGGRDRSALLVGVEDGFPGAKLDALPYAPHNLQLLKRQLCDPNRGIFPPAAKERSDIVRFLENPSRDEWRARLEETARDTGGLLLLYFCGHGVVDDDDLYLLPRGAKFDDLRATAMSWRYDVQGILRKLPHKDRPAEVVAVLDCCWSGAARHAPEGAREGAYVLWSCERNRLQPTTRHPQTTAPWLADATAQPDSGELPDPQYSFFTYELCSAMGSTQPGDPPLTMERLRDLLVPSGPAWSTGGRARWRPDGSGTGSGPGIVISRAPDQAAESSGFQPPPWSKRARKPLLAATALAVATGAVIGLVQPWDGGTAGSSSASCPTPQELRVATAPEDLQPMRDLAARFVRSEANTSGDCRRSGVTVYAAGLDRLREGFSRAGEWGRGGAQPAGATAPGKGGATQTPTSILTDVGPQPDLWLAPSTAALAYVSEDAAVLREAPTPARFAVNRMALVVTPDAGRRLGLAEPGPGGTGRTGWADLRPKLRGSGVRLLRPDPAQSVTGLHQALGMHAADPAHTGPFTERAGDGDEDAAEQAEAAVSHVQGLPDETAALCALTTAAKGPPTGPGGALVSLDTAERALPAREAPRLDCPGGTPKDGPYWRYELVGAPALDYRLVRPDWSALPGAPGVPDRREEALQDLVDWLGSEESRADTAAAGFRRGSIDPTVRLPGVEVARWIERLRDARQDLRLSVLFDASGSMHEGGRFRAAREAVLRSLERLGPDDAYSLTLFARGKDGRGFTQLEDRWRTVGPHAPAPALDDGLLNDRDERHADLRLALGREVAAVTQDASADRHAILLITDGEYLPGGRKPRIAALRELAARLYGDETLIVMSLRPYGCEKGKGVPGEAAELAQAAGGTCHPAAEVGEIAAEVGALAGGEG
ncbi:hypothetical protein AB0M28_32865 [Streptomyces sp. NPDC051940]|uniref:hypothetical protein n=1 Tax=Streptomyces sp. NPDC051940 TaxID=3155675 RepID=UPI0034333B83